MQAVNHSWNTAHHICCFTTRFVLRGKQEINKDIDNTHLTAKHLFSPPPLHPSSIFLLSLFFPPPRPAQLTRSSLHAKVSLKSYDLQYLTGFQVHLSILPVN